MPVEVKKWISYDEADEYEQSVGGWGGWFENGMRWKDYIKEAEPELKEYYEAIRRSVVERGARISGDQHQTLDDGAPLFDDDTVGMFTFRAWGDLMAAIWAEEDDKDYNYMDFYVS